MTIEEIVERRMAYLSRYQAITRDDARDLARDVAKAVVEECAKLVSIRISQGTPMNFVVEEIRALAAQGTGGQKGE